MERTNKRVRRILRPIIFDTWPIAKKGEIVKVDEGHLITDTPTVPPIVIDYLENLVIKVLALQYRWDDALLVWVKLTEADVVEAVIQAKFWLTDPSDLVVTGDDKVRLNEQRELHTFVSTFEEKEEYTEEGTTNPWIFNTTYTVKHYVYTRVQIYIDTPSDGGGWLRVEQYIDSVGSGGLSTKGYISLSPSGQFIDVEVKSSKIRLRWNVINPSINQIEAMILLTKASN